MNWRPQHVFGFLLIPAVTFFTATAARADNEEEVTAVFVAFQAALKAGGHEKIWALLDTTTRDDADKHAKAIQASYGKADDDEKAKLEKAFGLSADDMSKLTGKLYLKSKPFLAKYRDVPGSKIDKVAIDGDKATVNYIDEDDDKEKLQLNRLEGKWKLSIRVK